MEYEEWKVRFNEASAAMEEREEKILQVSCEIEKDLDLLGRSWKAIQLSFSAWNIEKT